MTATFRSRGRLETLIAGAVRLVAMVVPPLVVRVSRPRRIRDEDNNAGRATAASGGRLTGIRHFH